jgi:hypothetical protein
VVLSYVQQKEIVKKSHRLTTSPVCVIACECGVKFRIGTNWRCCACCGKLELHGFVLLIVDTDYFYHLACM